MTFSAGIAVGIVIQSKSAGQAGAATAPTATSEAERRERGENFFGGDPDRDIRSGQEMRPRW
ncbi:entry exclusion protein TrbK [Mesorhizobium zhangyense]|nr:entry exclusion protein TrbK [Mesorhizobium zhangyense]